MSFRFNFSNDSDLSVNDEPLLETEALTSAAAGPHSANSPQFHSLSKLAETIPHNISYSTLVISQSHQHGREILLPRRELYDVRMQLMDEDEDLGDDTGAGATTESTRQRERESLAEFVNGNEDVRTGTYEGGLKSWECSVDVVKYLSEAGTEELGRLFSPESSGTRVLELGCGTSLPTLFLFQIALNLTEGLAAITDGSRRFTFHLADYNHSVLRLVTLPNIFLSWALHKHPELFTSSRNNAGDLSVLPELKEEFITDLSVRGIELGFISGCWGDDMLSRLAEAGGKEEAKYGLVIGSETIYEPKTVLDFTKVLLETVGNEVGLVGAKKIYFGVGGSVGDFVQKVERWGGSRKWGVRTVKEVGLEGSGVGRVVLEVRAKHDH